MAALVVVPLAPVPNDPPPPLKGLDRALPDTLLFQAPKEPFDHAVLLRRVRRDELLLQAVLQTRMPKPPTLEDEAIATP